MNRTYKLLIAGALLLLIGIAVAVIIAQNTGFRVVSRDPSGDIPLSVSQISFTLSDAIKNKSEVELKIEPSIAGDFTVEDKNIVFTPGAAFEKNQKYTLIIRNAHIDADSKIHSTKYAFSATYVPYDKLSDAEKARQMKRTNPVQQEYPITRDLPYVTSSFKMEYTPPVKKEDPITIRITPLISQSRGESLEQYQARLLTIKEEAEAYLASKGHDPKGYQTYYQDIFLLQYSTTPLDSDH
jgi:hypothetical protein